MKAPQRFRPKLGALLVRTVAAFREEVRFFYYEVTLLGCACPVCGGKLRMAREAQAICAECQAEMDPTLALQTCTLCGGQLRKEALHYECAQCGEPTRSQFAFDPRVFDRAYFARMMRKSRKQRQRQRQHMIERLQMSRSDHWRPTGAPDLDAIPGLNDSLDAMAGAPLPPDLLTRSPRDPELDMNHYRKHILDHLGLEEALFDSIPPLLPDEKRDRAFRFVAAVFMCQDGQVDLIQQNETLVVARNEPDRKG